MRTQAVRGSSTFCTSHPAQAARAMKVTEFRLSRSQKRVFSSASSDCDFGAGSKSQLQMRLGVGVNTHPQQAGEVHALGARGATTQDASQGAILVARAAVLQDAHGVGCGACWHVAGARAAVAVGCADTSTCTLHLSLRLITLAGRLLIVAAAGSWRGRRRGRRGRGGRWARAGHHRVGSLSLDAALTRASLATLELHKALLTPGGTPAVLNLRGDTHRHVLGWLSSDG